MYIRIYVYNCTVSGGILKFRPYNFGSGAHDVSTKSLIVKIIIRAE